jgi:hypothetical protein
MKYLLSIVFILLFHEIFAQDSLEVKKAKRLGDYNKEFYKKYPLRHCFQNKKDSTENVADWADTLPYLKYTTKERIAYLEYINDSINKLYKKNKIYTKKEKVNTHEIAMQYGLIWYLLDNFDTSYLSVDYSFSIALKCRINCRGEIYHQVLFNESQYNNSKYYAEEFSKYAKGVNELVLKLSDEVKLVPPYWKNQDKNFNLGDTYISFSSNRKKSLYVRVRYPRDTGNGFSSDQKK